MNTHKNIEQLKSAIKSKAGCRKIKSDNIVFFNGFCAGFMQTSIS